MATLSDLKLAYRLFMQIYPYRKLDWGAGSTLKKPIEQARIAVVTTAAFHRPNQPAFDTSIKGGDCSYRALDADVDLATLEIAHRSDAFDMRGINMDKNLALPLDRLKALAREGVIGEVAPRHFSFMGSIVTPGRLIKQTAPEVAAALLDDGVDAVLLTPVSPMCHQSVVLIQNIIEKAGIPTISISMLHEVTERVAPPRVLFADFALGCPLGLPNDPPFQTRNILAMLTLLKEPVPPGIKWQLLASG